jgi:hypothetical protein
MNLRIPASALLLLLVGPAALSASGLSLDYTAEASYLWTENLGRASGQTDFRDTSGIEADVTVGASRQLSSGLVGRVQLEAGALVVPDYELVNEATFGPRAILSKKFGLGPQAPVLALEAATIGRIARIDENNGVTLQGAATLSKRFNSVLSARLRGDWQEHVADAATYDVHHLGVEGGVSVDATDRLRFTLGGGYLDGTFTAGASAARFAGALAGALGPEVASYYAGVPQTVTDAFGPGWVAYRVEGDAYYHFLELSPAITDQIALNLRYERVHATNIVDVDYRQDIFSLSAIYRF